MAADNDCYISAYASFFGLAFYYAYVALLGGPPPAAYQEIDLQFPLELFVEKLKAEGFQELTEPDNYQNLREPALMIVYWAGPYKVNTLHTLVWDGRKRIDPGPFDTVKVYNGKPLKVLTLP